ncbi:MAG: WYL domain-containing protein [Propionibacteriales bacterium]|nr:WYL domain-containing protein [Propionibacteriales bacterium]
MLETSARLLGLLSLLQMQRDWTGAELAARLDVTTRTVRRDIDRVRRLGYRIDAVPGVAGGYRLGAGSVVPPLLLDEEEAVAVAVGLRTAAGGSVAGMEEASLRALTKLEPTLPSRLRRRVAALQSSTVPLLSSGRAADPEVLAVIALACRDLERLRFGYRDRSGTPTRRTVEPYRLVHTGRTWYLLARDLDREDWRTFRVDRMYDPEPTGRRFTATDLPDAATYVAHAVSSAPYRYQARVRIHAPAAETAARIPVGAAVVEPIDDETCVLAAGSESLDALALHLAMLDLDFEVLEPPELADRVAALGRRLARATRIAD